MSEQTTGHWELDEPGPNAHIPATPGRSILSMLIALGFVVGVSFLL